MKQATLLVMAGLLAAPTAGAWAQSPDYLTRNRAVARAYYGRSANGVMANGRCDGKSFGTGARSCGTATGGPVGGINSRN